MFGSTVQVAAGGQDKTPRLPSIEPGAALKYRDQWESRLLSDVAVVNPVLIWN